MIPSTINSCHLKGFKNVFTMILVIIKCLFDLGITYENENASIEIQHSLHNDYLTMQTSCSIVRFVYNHIEHYFYTNVFVIIIICKCILSYMYFVFVCVVFYTSMTYRLLFIRA